MPSHTCLNVIICTTITVLWCLENTSPRPYQLLPSILFLTWNWNISPNRSTYSSIAAPPFGLSISQTPIRHELAQLSYLLSPAQKHGRVHVRQPQQSYAKQAPRGPEVGPLACLPHPTQSKTDRAWPGSKAVKVSIHGSKCQWLGGVRRKQSSSSVTEEGQRGIWP